MQPKPFILPVIILSQFACTSLWFAGNSISNALIEKTGLGHEIIGYVLSSVQLGFVAGTLVFALLMIADRFPPSRVFLICALLAATCNMLLILEEISKWTLLSARFGTGFFLAGIYPVGMKIAADYYETKLGKALGFLVGALVLGTALPYFVSETSWGNNPNTTIITVSTLSAFGGLFLWLLVPNGPYRKPAKKLQLNSATQLFKITAFRKTAFGYFGHMWELYAFWAFTPFALQTFNRLHSETLSVPLWTGIVIALGGVSCVFGGLASQQFGSYRIAKIALTISGLFCLISPLLFQFSTNIFLMLWCLWAMALTTDSPQFSNLVASSVPAELKGTGLTLVNCIGFAISSISIQLLVYASSHLNTEQIFLLLAIGPLLGVLNLRKKSS